MSSSVLGDALPEVDAMHWGGQIQDVFFPLRLHVDRSVSFFADARLSLFPRCRIARVKASAHSVSMSAEACRRVHRRHIKVLWQVSGTGRLERAGQGVDLPPGHWTVYEATQPYELSMSDNASFVALVCEVKSRDGFDYLNSQISGRVLPTEGGSAVALAAVDAVNAAGDRLSPASQGGTADFVSALLSQEIQFQERRSAAVRRRTPEALLFDAQQYVRQNLECPDLSPDQIAAALHVCRRTLYHAFASAGETPHAFLQRVRLERCREILSQGEVQGANITQLAFDFGFSDPAYFSRVFRRRFGLTPSQCRATAYAAQFPR